MSVNFKQIYFNELNGKLKLLDSTNNNYECNIYGEKNPEFLPKFSGTSGHVKRINIQKINKFKNDLYNPQSSR